MTPRDIDTHDLYVKLQDSVIDLKARGALPNEVELAGENEYYKSSTRWISIEFRIGQEPPFVVVVGWPVIRDLLGGDPNRTECALVEQWRKYESQSL